MQYNVNECLWVVFRSASSCRRHANPPVNGWQYNECEQCSGLPTPSQWMTCQHHAPTPPHSVKDNTMKPPSESMQYNVNECLWVVFRSASSCRRHANPPVNEIQWMWVVFRSANTPPPPPPSMNDNTMNVCEQCSGLPTPPPPPPQSMNDNTMNVCEQCSGLPTPPPPPPPINEWQYNECLWVVFRSANTPPPPPINEWQYNECLWVVFRSANTPPPHPPINVNVCE